MANGLLIVVYGQQKTGKTLAAMRVAAGGAMYMRPGAHPLGRYGVEPEIKPMKPLVEMIKVLRSNTDRVVLLDDISLLASDSMNAPGAQGKIVAANVGNLLSAAREAATKGAIVIVTAHEAEAFSQAYGKVVQNTRRVVGGPKLLGQQQSSWTAEADIVLRVQYDPDAPFHPWVWQARASAAWAAGDRLDVFEDGDPLSLWAGLRARGVKFPEHPEIAKYSEHMKVMVGKFSEDLSQYSSIITESTEDGGALHGIPPRLAKAICFDAWALARFKARG